MAPRSLAMASSTSAFSVSMPSTCWLSAVQLLVGLQVDAAEPLAVGLEARRAGARPRRAAAAARPAASSASARQPSGAQPSCSRMLARTSSARARARLRAALRCGRAPRARRRRRLAPRAAPARPGGARCRRRPARRRRPGARARPSPARSSASGAARSIMRRQRRRGLASSARPRRGAPSSVAICCSAPAERVVQRSRSMPMAACRSVRARCSRSSVDELGARSRRRACAASSASVLRGGQRRPPGPRAARALQAPASVSASCSLRLDQLFLGARPCVGDGGELGSPSRAPAARWR